MEVLGVLILWLVLGVLLGLFKIGVNMLMLGKVFFLIASILLMIWNYKSIETSMPKFHEVNLEWLMRNILIKLIVHTILWTIFLISFVLIIAS